MADRGRYFAICCVDDFSTEVVDEFLTAAYSAEYIEPGLVVIDSLDKTYVEPTRPPVGSLSPPFKGKNARECCKLVQKMTQQTKSDINYECFVILDERSTEDSTALIIGSVNEGNEIRSFRAVFDVVNLILLSMSAGFGSMSENREIADAQPDGVFRLHPRPPKPETSTQHKSAPAKILRRHE